MRNVGDLTWTISQDLPFGGTKASGYGRFGNYIVGCLLVVY